MAHCISNPMGKAAIVHTNYPIKTEKLFCGADKGAWDLGEGEKKKWAGERGVIGKMAILKVENREVGSKTCWSSKIPTRSSTRTPPHCCTTNLHIWSYAHFSHNGATLLTVIRISGSLKIVWILHSKWMKYLSSNSVTLPPSKSVLLPPKLPEHLLPLQALHTSMSPKALQRGSEHGKTPCHKS